eukprot:c1244_g1_i1.p1 GENE.c1244_g1_i1~~c1244_g1_i1.p1  ORF type:complete len:333 (-),score=95.06 c1244_g1_i1:66-1064(-)
MGEFSKERGTLLMTTKQAGRVVVVGSCITDLIGYTHRLPAVGETLKGHKFAVGFGGKGANQAVQAALLGSSVSMVSKIGDDTFGQGTLQNFKARGVNADHVTVEQGGSTGIALIQVDDSGHNSILIIPGSLDQLTPQSLASDSITLLLTASNVLLCQLETPLDTTVAAMRIAHASGLVTVLNTAPAPPDANTLTDEILGLATVVCPNEPELATITGMPTSTMAEVEAAARHVICRGAQTVLVTLGERGAVLVQATHPHSSRHFPATKVMPKDTTGAGDSFLGAFAHFVASGMSIEDAIPKANLVASVSVQRLGTQSSFANQPELQQIYPDQF